MKYEKPRLPYASDALAPVISQETVEFHYGKHESAYIDTLNSLIEGTKYADMSLEEIICTADGKLFNNASQAWNHIFYFFQFNPDGQKEPTGALHDAIERQFGSIDKFKEEFEQAGATLFGSGWVWLSKNDNDELVITQGPNAANPMTEGLTPLLTFDVWEHAYYLDYQNRRAVYLHELWDIVDWSVIELRWLNK